MTAAPAQKSKSDARGSRSRAHGEAQWGVVADDEVTSSRSRRGLAALTRNRQAASLAARQQPTTSKARTEGCQPLDYKAECTNTLAGY